MSLQDRDKTTAYTEACFLGISEPSPKSTVDARRHPSEDNDGLPPTTNCLPRRPCVSPNCFSGSQASTRAGLTRARAGACRFTTSDDHRRLPGLCAWRRCSLTASVRPCNSWPPFFSSITSYQSRAGCSATSLLSCPRRRRRHLEGSHDTPRPARPKYGFLLV